jgi:DNA-directed RNA polymerase subunit H (RpoH/RPB5)
MMLEDQELYGLFNKFELVVDQIPVIGRRPNADVVDASKRGIILKIFRRSTSRRYNMFYLASLGRLTAIVSQPYVFSRAVYHKKIRNNNLSSTTTPTFFFSWAQRDI